MFFLHLAAGCAPGSDVELQQVEATEEVDLPAILSELPAIESMVHSINLGDIEKKPVTGETASPGEITRDIQSLMRLAQVVEEPMPELVSAISYGIHSSYKHFAGKAAEFSKLADIKNWLWQQEPAAIADLAHIAARITYHKSTKFDSAETLPTPSLLVWKLCGATLNSYLSSRDAIVNDASVKKERKQLISQYTRLRTIYCALKEKGGRVSDNIGELVYSYLDADKKNNPDAGLQAVIDISQIQNDMADTTAEEANLVKWFAADYNKTRLLDLLLHDGVAVLNSDLVFEDLQTNLDGLSGLLAGRNPRNNEYLLTDMQTALFKDAGTIADLDNIVPGVVETMPMVKNLHNLVSSDTGHSLKSALNRYGRGNLLDISFGEREITGNTRLVPFPAMCFGKGYNKDACYCMRYQVEHGSPSLAEAYRICVAECSEDESVPDFCDKRDAGLNGISTDNDFGDCLRGNAVEKDTWTDNGNRPDMCYHTYTVTSSPPGFLKNEGPVYSSNPSEVLLRTQSGVNLQVGTTYLNETYADSVLNNIKVLLTENFGGQPEKLHFSREQALNKGQRETFYFGRFLNQLQYSINQLVNLDRFGQAGTAQPSLLSSLGYLAGAALEGGPLTFKLKDMLRKSPDLAHLGSFQVFAPLGDFLIDTQIACTYDHCDGIEKGFGKYSKIKMVYRNDRPYVLNTEMAAAELFTPGQFVPRGTVVSEYQDKELYRENWQGQLSPHQGDVAAANSGLKGVINSLIAMNTWQGHGPFTFRGRAPNGTELKYQNSFYTDTYSAEYQPVWNGEKYKIALGTNLGLIDDDSGDQGENALKGIRDHRYYDNASGNIEIFENIYRPGPGEPCYDRSTRYGKFDHPRFGYLRPSNNTAYRSPSCTAWAEIQIDFDSREEAILANMRWLSYFKKLTIIVPASTQEEIDAKVAGVGFEANARAAGFVIVQANGLMGLVHLRPAYGDEVSNHMLMKQRKHYRPSMYNGSWNFFSNRCPTQRYNEDYIFKQLGGSYNSSESKRKELELRWFKEYYGITRSGDYDFSFNRNHITAANCSPCDPTERRCKFGERNKNGHVDFTNAGADMNLAGYETSTRAVVKNSATFNSIDGQNGATITHRFKKTSFEPGDSRIMVLISIQGFREARSLLNALQGVLTTFSHQSLVSKALGMIPLGESNLAWNTVVPTLRTLFSEFETGDITDSATSNSMGKFERFYGHHFKQDDYSANGEPYPDGQPDMWQKYMQSHTYPGCKSSEGIKIDFCFTALEMPHVPRIKGVSYPNDYNELGQVTSWQTYEGENEFRFEPLLLGFAVAMGTEYDRRQRDSLGHLPAVRKSTLELKAEQNEATPISSINEQFLKSVGNESRKPRSPFYHLFEEQGGLSKHVIEHRKSADNVYEVEYNPAALLNVLVETEKGHRDGFLPYLFTRNFWHIPALQKELSASLNHLLQQFHLFKKVTYGDITTWQKIRYFFTKDISGPGRLFQSNGLQNLDNNPAELAKALVGQLRKIASDPAMRDVLANSIEIMRRASTANGKVKQTDTATIRKALDLLKAKNAQNQYIIESIIDTLVSHDALDPDFFINFRIDKLQALLGDLKPDFMSLNGASVEIFGPTGDIRRLAYGILTDEPWYDANGNGTFEDGEPFYDFNGDFVFNRGMFSFGQFSDTEIQEITDNDGNYAISVRFPDYFDLLNYKPRSEGSEFTLTRSTLGTLFDEITGLDLASDFADKVKEKLTATTVIEPFVDYNNNGHLEADEFTDYNKNGVRDLNLPLVEYLDYLGSSIESDYLQASASGDLGSTVSVINQFLNPQCDQAESGSCLPLNDNYITGQAIDLRNRITTGNKLKPGSAMAVREVIGSFLYDHEYRLNTNILSNFQQARLPMLLINRGAENDNRDSTLRSFGANGFSRHLANHVSLGSQYSYFDVLKDLNRALHIRQLRDYQTSDTLWWQLSHHLTVFAKKAYQQNDQSFVLNSLMFDNFSDLW